MKNIKSIVYDVEFRLFQYYREHLSIIRENIDENLWELKAPKLESNDVNRFKELIKPTIIYIPQTFEEDKIIYGVIFSCKWEDECGIAVKFEDEQVTVGTDDIIM